MVFSVSNFKHTCRQIVHETLVQVAACRTVSQCYILGRQASLEEAVAYLIAAPTVTECHGKIPLPVCGVVYLLASADGHPRRYAPFQHEAEQRPVLEWYQLHALEAWLPAVSLCLAVAYWPYPPHTLPFAVLPGAFLPVPSFTFSTLFAVQRHLFHVPADKLQHVRFFVVALAANFLVAQSVFATEPLWRPFARSQHLAQALIVIQPFSVHMFHTCRSLFC